MITVLNIKAYLKLRDNGMVRLYLSLAESGSNPKPQKDVLLPPDVQGVS